MLVSPTLSLPAATMSMLLPVHAPFEGFVIATVGGVVSPLAVPFETVTLFDAHADLPVASVTVRVSVCVPFGTVVVFHVVVAPPLPTVWSSSVVALSSFSTNRTGDCVLAAVMVTPVLVPLTVAPSAGLLIAAINPGGGVEPPPQLAPAATVGDVAS